VAASISEDKVINVLRPWLGPVILDHTSLAREAAHLLRQYSPFRKSLDELRDEIENHIFNALHRHLGVSMSVRFENGSVKRIFIRDIEIITDDLMGVLFDSLSVYSVNYELLNAYALSHASLSSLRVLYQRFSEWMSEAERQKLVSVITDTYPPERYKAWLASP